MLLISPSCFFPSKWRNWPTLSTYPSDHCFNRVASACTSSSQVIYGCTSCEGFNKRGIFFSQIASLEGFADVRIWCINSYIILFPKIVWLEQQLTVYSLFIVSISVSLSAHLTPESSALRMAESCSVKSGSTLVWMETSLPRASAALSLTPRLESCRAFRKVVCSWGRKGFRAMPTWRRNTVQRLEPHTVAELSNHLHVPCGDAGSDLRQQQGESLQQSRLHRPGKAVSQDTNERSSDVDDRGPQCFGGGQFDDPS